MVAAGAQDAGDLDGEAVVELAVETGQRLVEEQSPRRRGERPGEGDPLRLTAAQLGDRPGSVAGEADDGEHLGDPRVAGGPVEALHPQPEGDVAGDVAVWEQLLVLEHHADPAAMRRHAGDVDPVETDRARGDRDEAGDGAQQRALAAARRAEQGDDLAVGDGERDAPSSTGRSP